MILIRTRNIELYPEVDLSELLEFVRHEGIGWDEMGWDGMGGDEIGWEEMGWDEMR